MDTQSDAPMERAAGPTLYLESGSLDPARAFCTDVFDGGDVGEYRVVQLVASQSFESVSDELNARLEHIDDPSEAAVIITTPQDDDESTATRVGEETPLYGFRVSPQDLTGISIAFSRILEKWEQAEGSVRICLRDVESLLPYHDTELLYRFLNTVLATLQGAGADVHMHLRPDATDDRTLRMFSSLFDRVFEADGASRETEPKRDGTEAAGEPSDAEDASSETEPGGDSFGAEEPDDIKEADEDADDVIPVTMDDDEIASFLTAEGHGVLAFGGESPYAIPMSYGYDPDERAVYVHISEFEGSQKAARLDGPTPVSLVVSRYEGPDRWRSVVVDGTLSELSEADVERRDVFENFKHGSLASVDVFNRPLSDISFEWYVLDPSAISGRQGVRSR
ncbi:FMN-binding domain protein [Natronomonas moolapensis 8.8.11]|uniref:FMN-binding domain protein n=1 Tax=Natronomonas moolapensis (strain DSM 18674 / CECT 7526 / JCM 14361 / 8.8.11) TaxID=268739 RepID=M1Y4J8_NATM8|nr:pyridoxamine 5'-phosphate oxidase family protein [Natronomonas moolapensis]CCQ37446.1 FMN-binding domain protein [Natronomonas moolapensis 8.8.11]